MHANRAQRPVLMTCPAAQSLRLSIQVKCSGRGIDSGAGFTVEGDKGRSFLVPVCERCRARVSRGVVQGLVPKTQQHRPGMETNP